MSETELERALGFQMREIVHADDAWKMLWGVGRDIKGAFIGEWIEISAVRTARNYRKSGIYHVRFGDFRDMRSGIVGTDAILEFHLWI
jgi:hypothetical protein